MNDLAPSPYYAAIDLGSNSFHMVVAKHSDAGGIDVIDRIKEMVQLNASLDQNRMITQPGIDRALTCLSRFRQRCSSIPSDHIRTVATDTLRTANNSEQFLELAEQALGQRISVISGHEEARLVYKGAAFDLAPNNGLRLVVDIGGGSTEMVIGEGQQPIKLTSLFIGCVSGTRKTMSNGNITPESMAHMKSLVKREMESICLEYKEIGWNEAVGTSGTIKSISAVSRNLGLGEDWIDHNVLSGIEKWILKHGHSRELIHVSQRRRSVFVAGFLILSCIFEMFSIKKMAISQGALREGVLCELVGRLHDEDSRMAGIDALMSRFDLDRLQYKRVAAFARYLFINAKPWGLRDPDDWNLLEWASQLHEIGFAVSHNQHHRHGAYIIENSDIDGFTREEQTILALLVFCHRQKLSPEVLDRVPEHRRPQFILLLVLLRLSVAVHRGRVDTQEAAFSISVFQNGIDISVSTSWAEAHPLTLFDLQTEINYLEVMGLYLSVTVEAN